MCPVICIATRYCADVSSGLHTGKPHDCDMLGVRLYRRVRNADVRDGSAYSDGSRSKGITMGDRGGKKDKKKNQQQLATKQKHKQQRKLDKAPARPLAGNA